ncbi:MAG: regulatory protein GemA [Candidatus Gastranaerophilales bacterium]|nr:regulatory protein GemA [Candidatus Gastranaerophilales bacterium]
MIKSSAKQRQLIGFLRKQLKIDADIYYDILSSYNVESSKDLSYQDAEEILSKLKKEAIKQGVYTPKTNYEKYGTMYGRFGMGTPKQLRKIEAMWMNISNQKTENSMNKFIYRITGKQRLNFLTQMDVRKVIKALETMQQQSIAGGK